MGWVIVKNPNQELLDELLEKARSRSEDKCPDCGVSPGSKHQGGCDVERCLTCGGQRLSCDCNSSDGDTWDGLWPGTMECYKRGLVAKWEGPGPFQEGSLIFDYNRLAEEKFFDGSIK